MFYDLTFAWLKNATIFQVISYFFFIFRNFECYYNYVHFSSRIKVTFSYLDLENGYDYVEIYDGKKVGY